LHIQIFLLSLPYINQLKLNIMYHKVTWTIDIDAENPLDAAKQALEIMQDKGSEALAFEVFDAKDKKVADIDLLEADEEADHKFVNENIDKFKIIAEHLKKDKK